MNIIVTGASRGIGYELVKQFAAQEGNLVFALSRNREKLDQLKRECGQSFPGSEVVPLSTDLANEEEIVKLAETIVDRTTRIDILVNNAGALVNKSFEQITGEDFDRVFQVNVKSVVQLIQAVKTMMGEGSHIVNISSMGGYQGSAKFPGLSVYSASKGAVAVLTECLAEEFKNDGICVNCLALGAVQTEMLEEAFPGYEAPLSSEQMAGYIADFAKEGHRFYNGKILPVSLSTP